MKGSDLRFVALKDPQSEGDKGGNSANAPYCSGNCRLETKADRTILQDVKE